MTELKLVTLMQWFMMGFPPDLSEKNTEFYIIFRNERVYLWWHKPNVNFKKLDIFTAVYFSKSLQIQ